MSGRHSEGWQNTSWRLLVVVVAIQAIAFNIATRSSVPIAITTGTTVQSSSPFQIHQRLDNDAGIWAPPVLPIVSLEVSSEYPGIAPAGLPIPHVLFDESLANRPPPSC